MVFIALKIKCQMENVTNLHAPPGYQWCLTVKQSDGSEEKGPVFVNEEEDIDLNGSKGTAHFVMKFEGSNKESYLNVVRDLKNVTKPYNEEDVGSWVTICVFECRGLEPITWHPQAGFNAQSTGGKRFEGEVDLTEDWCEYDDNKDLSLEITELEHCFETVKVKK
ncbi:hypothetical protein CYMTET_8531 [Cymbomonas tetramitiformis]|uniref:Uncharacterized protein n=1 Tax=Cymbomonas tetramitiformis TaxID=36881 RepID=A0AAE0LGE6_9CHLO|nr:hypothetical protein CYMTET_8531 [Cymbomonas tetramitiformis]